MPFTASSQNLRIEGKQKRRFLNNVAGYIYHKITSMASFPYDENEKRSADKRKIFGPPYHLIDRGGVFVRKRRVLGPNFQGTPPRHRDNAIQICFSNPKRVGEDASEFYSGGAEKLFDYATYVLDPRQTGDLRIGIEMEAIFDEAIEEGFEDIWSKP